MLKCLNIRSDLDQLKKFYMNLNSEMTDLLVANPFIYGAEFGQLYNQAIPCKLSLTFGIIYSFCFSAYRYFSLSCRPTDTLDFVL